jgi:hypothetical protein
MTFASRRAALAEARAQRELALVPLWLWNGGSLPVPIESIAENHYGMLVVERHSLDEYAGDIDAHVSGVLLTASGRILVDALEAARAPGRKRFTIAHELGHLVLDADGAGSRCGRPELAGIPAPLHTRTRHDPPAAFAYPPGELEANQFAAALLMPARHVRARGIDDAAELAEMCGVSVAAAEKRLEYLSWLGGGQAIGGATMTQ